MKWFKHISTASDDPAIHEAIQKFGPLGYWFYFGILELIASNFDPKMPGKLVVSWLQMQRKFRVQHKSVEKLLNFFQEKKKLVYENKDELLYIYVPKFQDYTDEYTRKQLLRMSGQIPLTYPDNVRTDSGLNRLEQKRASGSGSALQQRRNNNNGGTHSPPPPPRTHEESIDSAEYTSSADGHEAGISPDGDAASASLLRNLTRRIFRRRQELGLDEDARAKEMLDE